MKNFIFTQNLGQNSFCLGFKMCSSSTEVYFFSIFRMKWQRETCISEVKILVKYLG